MRLAKSKIRQKLYERADAILAGQYHGHSQRYRSDPMKRRSCHQAGISERLMLLYQCVSKSETEASLHFFDDLPILADRKTHKNEGALK